MTTEAETPEVTAPVEAATPEAPAKAVKVPSKCKCGLYSKVEDDNGTPVLVELVPCTATTNGNFAPGHDAKLKSQLIKLGATDTSVYKTVEGGEDVEMTAQDAANEYGFASKVREGIERAKTELATKADREKARADKKAAAETAKAEKKAEREKAAAERKAAADKAKADKKAAVEAAKTEAAATANEAKADAEGSDDESLF